MNQHVSIESVLNLAKKHFGEADMSRVLSAYKMAEQAHNGQIRRSGEPYIIHPLSVAHILLELEQDVNTVIGGLLHDTVEDTEITEKDIEDHFGDTVMMLVKGVTKLSKIRFGSKEEAQAENYRKMLLAMAQDVRVIIIKLADRLHNMRTLKHLRPDKQIRISQETHDIYAPLAHRLGMASLKWELEDLCFLYLHPEEFQKIKTQVSLKRHERQQYIDIFVEKIECALKKNEIKASVFGRPKHFYSIHSKLKKDDISFDDLYDMLGIRVIVEDIKECYEVLGIVHSLFKPIHGRFKDYIAMPKLNDYQSLHTTILGPEGKPVEIQIRSKEMEHVANFGIAAHWSYKEKKKNTNFKGEFKWLKQLLDSESESDAPQEFLSNLKGDLYMDEVFLFTPKGDVKVLKKGATPLDFAFSIHSEVGIRCVGAKVNNHIVPLHFVLSSGDRIEILTSKKQIPKVDWLNIVHTRQAKTKIRQWLKKQNRKELIVKGRVRVEKMMILDGFKLSEVLNKDKEIDLLSQYSVSSLDELYVIIEQGDITAKQVIKYLTKDFAKPVIPQLKVPLKDMKKIRKNTDGTIKVLGESNYLFTLAKCCSPLPGDDIDGIIVIGKGISVHRSDCKNILSLDEEAQSRVINVEWNELESKKHQYPISIQIEVFDRKGILQEIVQHFTDQDINLRSVRTKLLRKGAKVRISIVADFQDTGRFHKLKSDLNGIPDVLSVSRVVLTAK